MRVSFKPKLNLILLGVFTFSCLALSSCDGKKQPGPSSQPAKTQLADDMTPPTDDQSPSPDTAPIQPDDNSGQGNDSNGDMNNPENDQSTSFNNKKRAGLVSTTMAAGSSNFIASAKADKTVKPSNSQMPTSATAAGDWGAIAAFGELAPRNFRGSGTYGVYFTPTQRFKVSGEYLTQQLNFDFTSGHRKKWVSQLAVGAEYQYLLDHFRFQSIEIGTAYSHAFDKHLSNEEIKNGFVKRRIAGSNGSLSFLGTTAKLWSCAFLSAAVEYDWVRFDRKHQHDKLSNGFGGSFDFVQQFAKDFSLNLGAQFRQPFNSYQGLLNWNHRFSNVNLDIGVFGNLTDGHDGVRDIRTVGVQLGISFGPKPMNCGRSPQMSTEGKDCYARQYCDVSQWVATPAVYVPVVLVVADQEKKITAPQGCLPPTSDLIGTVTAPPNTTHDMNGFFHSTLPFTYSHTIGPFNPNTNNVAFDDLTGILTVFYGNDEQETVPVTITMTNACGSTTQSFIVQLGP